MRRLVSRILMGAAFGAVIVSALIYLAVERALEQTGRSVDAIVEGVARLDAALAALETRIGETEAELAGRIDALRQDIAPLEADRAAEAQSEPATDAAPAGDDATATDADQAPAEAQRTVPPDTAEPGSNAVEVPEPAPSGSGDASGRTGDTPPEGEPE